MDLHRERKFPSISCPRASHVTLLMSLSMWPSLILAQSVFVCAHTCLCVSVCHRVSLMTLYTAAGGWLRIRGKDHFLFHGKMNDPVWKWLPMASGQLEFAVSQQPSLFCVQRQVLEKKEKYWHLTHSAETNTTVIVNKLNAFSFLFFFFLSSCLPLALLTHFSRPLSISP